MATTRQSRAPKASSATRSTLSGGRPLDAGLRTWFEQRLPADAADRGVMRSWPSSARAGCCGDAAHAAAEAEAERLAGDLERSSDRPGPRANFGDIRIHADREAARSAQALGARAFTLGHDIVFGAGRFQPGTSAGRRLIAHELAHTLQQRSVPAHWLQRDLDEDFKVRGVNPESPDSPSRQDVVYFDHSSAEVIESQKGKIQALLTETPGEVHLYGFASEEGLDAFNARLVAERIAAVARVMREPPIALPDIVSIHSHPRPADHRWDPDLRPARSVQIVLDHEIDPPGVCDQTQPQVSTCDGRGLQDIRAEALRQLDNATAAVSEKRASAELALLFEGCRPDEVVSGLQRIRTIIEDYFVLPTADTGRQDGASATHIECATRCHPDCLAGFYAMAGGTSTSNGQLLLCPKYFEDRALAVWILIHEASHMAPGMRRVDGKDVGTTDAAYTRERLILHLGRMALGNAGSFQAFVMSLAGKRPVLGPPADASGFGTAPADQAQRHQASVAVAQAARWLSIAESQLLMVHGNLQPKTGGGRSGGAPTAAGGSRMASLDRKFGVRSNLDGEAADRLRKVAWRIAGLAAHYGDLARLMQRGLTLNPGPAGGVRWQTEVLEPHAVPGGTAGPASERGSPAGVADPAQAGADGHTAQATAPGTTLEFGPDFFQADPVERVRQVVLAAIAGTSSIRPELAQSYLAFAEEVRIGRGVPP